MYSEPLSKDGAVKVATAWIAGRVEVPRGYRGWNQFRWFMDQLATRCIAESLKSTEDEDQLCDRLYKAYEILGSVRDAGAPEIATRWWKEGEKPSKDEQEIINKARVTVWKRHDPKRSFEEGFTSEHYTAFFQQDFHHTVADYLDKPWLRHPVLDWVMIDMMISRELSAFGEELKQRVMPGPRDTMLFGVHARYYKAKGNLLKMRFPDLESLWRKAFWVVIVPIGAIYGAFHFGYESLGTSLLSLYGIAIAGWLGLKVLRFVLKVGYTLAGKTHPLEKPFVLWDQMYQVWKLLEGPIVNPTLVREMMVKARDQGAVWDVPAWSIVDRAIQYDPAVWTVQPSRS